MTTVNPTQPAQALRSTRRTCHQLGVCQNPHRSCLGGPCLYVSVPKRLAPSVVDGPYQPSLRSRSERISRIVLLGACISCVIVVLLQISGYL